MAETKGFFQAPHIYCWSHDTSYAAARNGTGTLSFTQDATLNWYNFFVPASSEYYMGVSLFVIDFAALGIDPARLTDFGFREYFSSFVDPGTANPVIMNIRVFDPGFSTAAGASWVSPDTLKTKPLVGSLTYNFSTWDFLNIRESSIANAMSLSELLSYVDSTGKLYLWFIPEDLENSVIPTSGNGISLYGFPGKIQLGIAIGFYYKSQDNYQSAGYGVGNQLGVASGETFCGGLYTNNTTWTTARDGTGSVSVTHTSDFYFFGAAIIGSDYYVGQCFGSFDLTNLTNVDEIESALISLSLDFDYTGSGNPTHALELYEYDFGVSVDATDWRTKAQLDGMTLLASFTPSAPYANQNIVMAGTADLITAIQNNAGGTLKYVLVNALNRSATAPTAATELYGRVSPFMRYGSIETDITMQMPHLHCAYKKSEARNMLSFLF